MMFMRTGGEHDVDVRRVDTASIQFRYQRRKVVWRGGDACLSGDENDG